MYTGRVKAAEDEGEEDEIAVVHNTMRDGGNIFECPKPEWRIVARGKGETKSTKDGGEPRYRSAKRNG